MTFLGDVLTLEYGKPLDSARRDPDGAVPVYGANGVKTFTTTPLVTQPTIVVGRKGSAGELVLVDQPCWPLDVTYYVTHDSAKTDLRYLFFFMSLCNLPNFAKGVKPGINRNDIYGIQFQSPPLAEQQRIVAKLDEIDSDLRTLIEHLDAEYLRSAQVRLSAVDSLFDGITAPEKPLAAVCDVFADGDWIESKDQSNTGIRLVQTGNVGDGVFKDRRDKARWIDENTFSRLNCTEVVPGDILFSRLPDPVGRACMIPDTGERMITAVDCTIARPSVKVVDPEFMVLFASSSRYFAQVRSMITGTTRDRISRKNLGDVAIPVPTLSEQKQIVLKAREIDSLCAEVSENIERRKAKAGELRQSVLAAAFRGEL
jgi:type I restriction enzyme S subunit